LSLDLFYARSISLDLQTIKDESVTAMTSRLVAVSRADAEQASNDARTPPVLQTFESKGKLALSDIVLHAVRSRLIQP
jgi:hypothetical protein